MQKKIDLYPAVTDIAFNSSMPPCKFFAKPTIVLCGINSGLADWYSSPSCP